MSGGGEEPVFPLALPSSSIGTAMSRFYMPNFAIAEAGGPGVSQFDMSDDAGGDQPFALSRYDLANSILATSKVGRKKKSSFCTARDVFYLRHKNTSLLAENMSLVADNTSLLAENDRLRSYMLQGAEYARDNIQAMQAIQTVSLHPCTVCL